MENRGWSEHELKILVDRVRVLRKTLGLSQREFAERIGVSRTHICKIEGGVTRISQKVVYRIEKTYGIDIAKNLDNDDWAPTGDLSVKMDWPALKREQQESLPPITKRIFELLKERNITQTELADSVGMTRASVSAWKRQKSVPNADKIIPICQALNVTPYYLLVGKEEGVPYPGEYL